MDGAGQHPWKAVEETADFRDILGHQRTKKYCSSADSRSAIIQTSVRARFIPIQLIVLRR